MKLHAKKRRGIGWALLVLLTTIIVLGVIWAALYYGGMVGTSNAVVNQYGTAIFEPNSYTFMQTVGTYWLIICTFVLLLWLWQQSSKRDLHY